MLKISLPLIVQVVIYRLLAEAWDCQFWRCFVGVCSTSFSCLWSWRGFQSGRKTGITEKVQGRCSRSSDEPRITDKDEKGGEGHCHGSAAFAFLANFLHSSVTGPIFLWETTASHPSSNGRRCEWIIVEHQPTYHHSDWLRDGHVTPAHLRDSFLWVWFYLCNLQKRTSFGLCSECYLL